MMDFKRFWLVILIVLSVVGSAHSADIRTGGGGHTIEDEGTPLTSRSTLNFVGDTVTCIDDSGNAETDCTIGISTGFVNVMNYGASGVDTTTTLSSDLSCASTSVAVADASSFVIGQGIMIEGANKGNPLVAKITNKVTNTLTIDTASVCDSESYLLDKAPNDTTANNLTESNSPVQTSESIQGSKHLSFNGSDATIQNLFSADQAEVEPSEILVCGSFRRDDITNSDLFLFKYLSYQINFDAVNASISGFTNNTSGTASTTLYSPMYSVAGTDTWYFACISHHGQDTSSTETIYDKVWTFLATWADVTTESGTTGGTPFSLPNDVSRYVYTGHVNKYGKIEFDFETLGAGYTLSISYSTGTSTWSTLSVTDGTSAFTQDGIISFTPPGDWAVGTVNGTASKYWVRIETTTVPTTTATANYIRPINYDTRLFLNGSEVSRSVGWSPTGLNQTTNAFRVVSTTEGWHGDVDWFVLVDVTSASYTVSKLQRLVEELYDYAGDASCGDLTTTNLSELVANSNINVCYDFESLQTVAATSGATVYHDDSIAIKAAIDSGYNVYIPKGNYNWSGIAKTVTASGLTIKGAGADDAHFQTTSVTNGATIRIRKNNSNILKLTGDGVIVEDIEFLSDKYNAGSGSVLTLGPNTVTCVAFPITASTDSYVSTNLTLRNLIVDSHDVNDSVRYMGRRLYGGILIKNVYKASISQIRITGVNGYGVKYDISSPCGDVDFSNSVIDVGGDGAVGILIQDSDYNKVTSVKVTSAGTGVWLRPDNSDIGTQIFTNLGTEDFKYYGIKIGSASGTYKAYRTQIIGGKIAANSELASSKIGLFIDTDAQYTLISNVAVDLTTLPIFIQGDYVNLTGVMVVTASTANDALRISTGASNVQITGGYFNTSDAAESSIQCYQADRVTMVGNRIPQGFLNSGTSCTNVVNTGNN